MATVIEMTYSIAVRALCEFTAKCGDLDLRFTPSPTAQEGITGHRAVTARRGAHYQTEVKLSGRYQELKLSGRADGYDTLINRLDEIKTYRGEFASIPQNHQTLHWAQAKIYGALQCDALGLDDIAIALIYFNVDTERETILEESFSASELQDFYSAHCAIFLVWARQEQAHRDARNGALQTLRFPYADFRAGQRELAESIYKTISTAKHLLAQAPTGIGKTVGTLFPLLKSMPTQNVDKGFYLTAKTTGRALALNAIAQIRGDSEFRLRTLELVARDKACEYPDRACHGDSCPLAQGFYDRLPQAREAAANVFMMDQSALRGIALTHQICPYYLSQEMARWSDIVIGDYNYYFDASAMLYSLATEYEWRTVLLIDEAHNLIERARSMYSSTLKQADIAILRKQAPTAIKRVLTRLQKQWRELADAQQDDYGVYDEIPNALLLSLQHVVAAIGDYRLKNPADIDQALQRFYFDAIQFCALAESFGDHSLIDCEKTPAAIDRNAHSTLCIRNVLPAPFLKQRFDRSQSAILFSATLFPADYHRDLLGLPSTAPCIDVVSPFSSEQLEIKIASHISTRFKQRQVSVMPIAQLIAAQYAAKPGNYIAYFSSFDYLDQIAEIVQMLNPSIPILRQTRRMDEQARSDFLNAFTDRSCYIGFAVLGGAFGEGIDLAGDRLIGAFVATLGLPQFNDINEQIKYRLERLFGKRRGYDYTYLYPGLQKVVQAAGRVIRSLDDRGSINLIDDRFSISAIQGLLPKWWSLSQCITPVEY